MSGEGWGGEGCSGEGGVVRGVVVIGEGGGEWSGDVCGSEPPSPAESGWVAVCQCGCAPPLPCRVWLGGCVSVWVNWWGSWIFPPTTTG